MDLRQLRSFLAAAEAGNISRAAQDLHLTQPALSRQIKALEQDLGVPLLERSAHSFSLTQAGALLLREGPALVKQADALEQTIRATGNAPAIRVGYSPSLAASILSPALEAFRQIHPKARVVLCDLSTNEMIDGLRKGSVDVVLTVPPEKEIAGVVWAPVQRQSWRMVVPPRHALHDKPVLVPGDLHHQRLVVYDEHEYPDYWAAISRWFRDHQMTVRIASHVDGLTSLISAVEAGLGLALVVDSVACLVPDRIALKPLDPPPEPLSIAAGVLERQMPNPVIAVLIEELRRAGQVVAARHGNASRLSTA